MIDHFIINESFPEIPCTIASGNIVLKIANQGDLLPNYQRLFEVLADLRANAKQIEIVIDDSSRVHRLDFLPPIETLRIFGRRVIDGSQIPEVSALIISKYVKVDNFPAIARRQIQTLWCHPITQEEFLRIAEIRTLKSLRLLDLPFKELEWSSPIQELAFESGKMRRISVCSKELIESLSFIGCRALENVSCKGAKCVVVSNCKKIDLGPRSTMRCCALKCYGPHSTKYLGPLLKEGICRLHLAPALDGYSDLMEAISKVGRTKASIFLEGIEDEFIVRLGREYHLGDISNGRVAFSAGVAITIEQFYEKAEEIEKLCWNNRQQTP